MHEDSKPPAEGQNPWIEIGIVSDEETRIAALIGIQLGGQYPLPSIQLGQLVGREKRFSPYLHPVVEWKDGKGEVVKSAIPESLEKQIADALRPHLVETRGRAVNDLQNFTLIERETADSLVITKMGCLSCS